MALFKKNSIHALGIIFIIAILFKMIEDTVPTLVHSSQILISQTTYDEDQDVLMKTKISIADYEAKGGDGSNFVYWCVNEMNGEIERTTDDAYCVIENPIPYHLLRTENNETYVQDISKWFKNNESLSVLINVIASSTSLAIQVILIYNLVILFSIFSSGFTMESFFKNLSNLRKIVACFSIMPFVSFVLEGWEDFYFDSFIYALLAIILAQFLHYFSIKYQDELLKNEDENNSYI